MLNHNLFRSFLVGVFLVCPIGAANADHFIGVCALELNTLEQAINDANFLGPRAASNRSNLLTKLEAAAAKLVQAKPSDAIDKLQSISDSATDLANAAKPKLEDATVINTSAGAAIQCVSANY